MVNILGGEGAYRRTAGRFYLAVIKAVILFGSETWVVTPWLEKALACFHQQTVRQMTGMGPIRQLDRTWVYTPIGAALVTVVLYEVRVYICLPPEHCRKIYCDSSYHVLVSGGGAEAGSATLKEMMGASLSIYPRDKRI